MKSLLPASAATSDGNGMPWEKTWNGQAELMVKSDRIHCKNNVVLEF